LESFRFYIFVGDVIIGVSLGIFRPLPAALWPQLQDANFVFFKGKLGKSRIIRALDWLSSVCGSNVWPKETYFLYFIFCRARRRSYVVRRI